MTPVETNLQNPSPAEPSRHGLFLPLLLLNLALLSWFGFQFTLVLSERQNLNELLARLETPVQNAQKIIKAANDLAVGTYQLASGGNASAKLVVDKLAQRGITINPNPGSQPNRTP